MYNYYEDRIGKVCLKFAERSKSDMKFGAVLVKGVPHMIGAGWNRRSTAHDRRTLTHLDYATHAEQGAIIEALSLTADISGSEIYVLGYNKHGELTIVEEGLFTCKKCAISLIRFNIPVNVPTEKGWYKLTPQQAYESACVSQGHWTRFRNKEG